VKILHSVDGEDVELWLEPRNISTCLRLLILSLFTLPLFTYLHTYIIYPFESISCVMIGIC